MDGLRGGSPVVKDTAGGKDSAMAMAACHNRDTVSDAILSSKGSGRTRHRMSYNFL